jgi:hypothetical protein
MTPERIDTEVPIRIIRSGQLQDMRIIVGERT